jgi:hypothetical protein
MVSLRAWNFKANVLPPASDCSDSSFVCDVVLDFQALRLSQTFIGIRLETCHCSLRPHALSLAGRSPHFGVRRMNMNIVAALAMALLVAGCGERIPSRVSEAPPPEIAPPAARHESTFVSTVTPNAPTDDRRQRPAPDFKDSAGSLDRSK